MWRMIYMMEHRTPESDAWWTLHRGWRRAPDDPMMIANLAGLDNTWGVKPAANERGIPSDASIYTRRAFQSWYHGELSVVPDLHASWITGEEYTGRIAGFNDQFDAELRMELRRVEEEFKVAPDWEWRLVFWFEDRHDSPH